MKDSYVTKKEADIYDKTSNELWDKLNKDNQKELLRKSKKIVDDNYKFIGEKE